MTHFQRLLAAQKDALGSFAKLAESAKVSNTTLYKIFDRGAPILEATATQGDQEPALDRKHAGLASSIARLCVFLDPSGKLLDPLKVAVEEYGVQESQRVRDAISQVGRDRRRPAQEGDLVLQAIRSRADLEDGSAPGCTGVVNLGLVVWQPFHDQQSENSFAFRFTSSMVKAIDPGWKIKPIEYISTSAAMQALVETMDADIVFGIYPAPARYAAGLEFIEVEGISTRLAMLRPQGLSITWRNIVDPAGWPLERGVQIVVLNEELSHLFLEGACGYKEGGDCHALHVEHQESRIPTKTVSAQSLAQSIRKLALTESKKEDRRDVVFISDPATCYVTLEALAANKRPKMKFEMVPGDDPFAPIYPVAAAVRSDAPVWRRLLQISKEEEIYKNWTLPLASLYVNVLSSEHATNFIWDWSLVPLKHRDRLQSAANAIRPTLPDEKCSKMPLKSFFDFMRDAPQIVPSPNRGRDTLTRET